ncbi:MAG: D-aminoacylase [Lentisphaerae bacterium]|nr:D-aminoacylase [Lentisphaerota bacterium]MBT4820601.1 D-aminoacylase [Lentisphaerota bacterium]MBT5604519.1 D-aminoacylase [Lentisphaerota bacterium]MBT7057675.1 D-aminoacylase [Lentisphaerota bacterium]MBT7841642.1 D-aminoacylase [Lentisphaerota bacterium]
MHDILIRNGRILDGTGAPECKGDIAIQGDRVVAVGDVDTLSATHTIDATDHIVCPGFIDVHTHCGCKPNLNYLHQGVTLVVSGNCGSSLVDISSVPGRLERSPSAVNMASLIGHNSVREAVMGNGDDTPSPEQLEQMCSLVAKGMRNGAVGFSSGLIYVPGVYAESGEVVALAKAASRHGGYYATHMRNEGDNVLAAIDEAVAIAEQAGMPLQISHHKVSGPNNWGRSTETLARLAGTRGRGLDVTQDQYPYLASSTTFHVMLPPWARAGEETDLLQRLQSADTRGRLKSLMAARMRHTYRGDISRVVVAKCAGDPAIEGMNLAQLTAGEGHSANDADGAAETALRLIEKHPKPGTFSAIFHTMDDGDLIRIMTDPNTMTGSDGGSARLGVGKPHPRNYGTFPRVLARYVREKGILTLPEAIRKMTSLPARRLGLRDRGALIPGAAADVVVLDPERITDQATYDSPHQYATGIQTVIVNGVPAITDGAHTGELPGAFVARPDRRPE